MRCLALFALLIFPVAVLAASPKELDRLHEALSTTELMAIVSEEGSAQSEELREEMFPGRGGIGWATIVRQIYDTDRLNTTFRSAFDEAMADADATVLLDFYGNETGRLVTRLEVEARRAIMSDEVEKAARNAYAEIEDTRTQRVALLEEFVDLNQLVDRNVAGALNANLAFYRGLGAGGGFEMTEDEMLTEVWGQEAEIRDDTRGWIFGYLTFAYETLSDDQIQAYIDVTATEAGQDLNRALFAGFDAVFQEVSFALGRATSRFSMGEEL